VDSVEILRGRTLSDDEYFKAAVLGWCIELVSANRSPYHKLISVADGSYKLSSSC
jgi:hypothetical protein